MNINEEIFREYDIRGVYGTDLSPEVAYLIGKAFGTKLKELNIKSSVVGHDNRLSSPILEENLVKGLKETGAHVIRLGLVTTPMCYFAANHLNTNCSMMITASHNPKEYNGFKFSYNGIHNAYGPSVKEIYTIIKSGNFASGEGSEERVDIKPDYIDLIVNSLNFGDRKIKVVYDPGNGTGSIVADQIFDRLKDKIDYVGICNVSDGNFPSHHPDPCIYENLTMLKNKVIETNSNLGVGYDGDADRVGFVDEKGNFIEIDKFLAIMWKYLVNKVDKKECLFDVKCSKTLEDELIKIGVKPVEYRTGNSYTRAASAEGNYPLSGELSGHVYFRDKFPGYDDGIYVGMRLIEMLSYSDKPLSYYLESLSKYYSTPEIKFKTTDEEKFNIVSKIKEYAESKSYNFIAIDGVKVKFDDGFALVRASNTGPNITARFEATTESRLNEIKNEFETELNKWLN